MKAPEKIYLFENPITETPDERWLTHRSCEEDIEYTRTDSFIEKACVKLKKLMYDNLMFQGRLHRGEVIDNFVEDFKNYIKEKWDIDNVARLWTIEDAKEGDVLCCESGWTCIFKTLVNDETFSSYCFMDKTKWFCGTGSECHTLNKEFTKAYSGEIKPATKEQRETLMKAIVDAGYKWDDEKKELIKIEEMSENYKQQVMSEMTDLAEDYIKQKPTNSCNSIDCTPIERF